MGEVYSISGPGDGIIKQSFSLRDLAEEGSSRVFGFKFVGRGTKEFEELILNRRTGLVMMGLDYESAKLSAKNLSKKRVLRVPNGFGMSSAGFSLPGLGYYNIWMSDSKEIVGLNTSNRGYFKLRNGIYRDTKMRLVRKTEGECFLYEGNLRDALREFEGDYEQINRVPIFMQHSA